MDDNRIKQIKTDIVSATRILDGEGLFKAFGHVSARVDMNDFLITPKKTKSTIDADELIMVSDDESEDGRQKPIESPIHAAIFRARADVNAICRIHPFYASVLATLGISIKTIHGFGVHIDRKVPICDNYTNLITEDSTAADVIRYLGDGEALVIRANGAVTVGSDIPQACMNALYLEEAASFLWHARCIGEPNELSHEEYKSRKKWEQEEKKRAWKYYKSVYCGTFERG